MPIARGMAETTRRLALWGKGYFPATCSRESDAPERGPRTILISRIGEAPSRAALAGEDTFILKIVPVQQSLLHAATAFTTEFRRF